MTSFSKDNQEVAKLISRGSKAALLRSFSKRSATPEQLGSLPRSLTPIWRSSKSKFGFSRIDSTNLESGHAIHAIELAIKCVPAFKDLSVSDIDVTEESGDCEWTNQV